MEIENEMNQTIREIPLVLMDEFKNHPFKVRMDTSMVELTESVKQYGVLVPAIIRPKKNGRYEMIAGHRRMMACVIAGIEKIPCIVSALTDEEATIIMVDSNFQREHLLPSEKAFAYQMKMDAIRRKAGRPGKGNGVPVAHHFLVGKSREIIAEGSPDSNTQIQRYIRLTRLIPELLDLVDNFVLKEKDKLQMALRPAVELSYLRCGEQKDVYETMLTEDCTPTHAQAIRMRKHSEEGKLDMDTILTILAEKKGNQREPLKIPRERIRKYFAPSTSVQKMEDTIVKALDFYWRYQRDRRKAPQ